MIPLAKSHTHFLPLYLTQHTHTHSLSLPLYLTHSHTLFPSLSNTRSPSLTYSRTIHYRPHDTLLTITHSLTPPGGFGSIGYGCVFKREEAMKNLLRTHTTAISAQMLYKLANQEGGFTPKKYFSIDRVFRNEAMDATHLCEFHQVGE